jgi:hypothetical protein
MIHMIPKKCNPKDCKEKSDDHKVYMFECLWEVMHKLGLRLNRLLFGEYQQLLELKRKILVLLESK